MGVWGPVSGAMLAGLRSDDQRLAEIVGTAVLAGSVIGFIGWEWYRQSKGPLADPGEPRPAKGGDPRVRVQLDPGEGFVVRKAARAYGTEKTIVGILDGVRAYHECNPGADAVRIGDVSKLGGGPFPPHVSHQTGRDVDIGLPAGEHARWCLLRAYGTHPNVSRIFYDRNLIAQALDHAQGMGGDDAAIAAEILSTPDQRRTVQHWPGHADHIHVRFQP